MGGLDALENIASLTAREHLLAHLLLVKMTSGRNRYKMIFALHAMTMRHSRTFERAMLNSRQLAELRELRVSALSEVMSGPGNPFYGRTHTEYTKKKMQRPKTDEQKAKQSAAMKGRYLGRSPANKGKRLEEMHSREEVDRIKSKMRHCGPENGFYGKTPSDEQRERKRQEKLNDLGKMCPHCGKQVGAMNYGRWHGDKCKWKTEDE
jgi:hypothetical protein